ncbi:MAG: N-acetyltransferase family protein [Thalassospira sp.]|uniref:GNAT family N-acetyltransferase n=1 Tax=Thalassospira sp. TaxID=1912094 RepID=UPI003A889E36
MVEIARSAFSFTRFHRDRRLGTEIGDLVKAAWVQNYFRGQRGDGMLVAHMDDQVVGFLLYMRSATGDLDIDLIAVARHATRQGVGQQLILALIDKLELKQLVKVGTQACNIPSHNLYSGLGFQLMKTVNVLHFHADDPVEREA